MTASLPPGNPIDTNQAFLPELRLVRWLASSLARTIRLAGAVSRLVVALPVSVVPLPPRVLCLS